MKESIFHRFIRGVYCSRSGMHGDLQSMSIPWLWGCSWNDPAPGQQSNSTRDIAVVASPFPMETQCAIVKPNPCGREKRRTQDPMRQQGTASCEVDACPGSSSCAASRVALSTPPGAEVAFWSFACLLNRRGTDADCMHEPVDQMGRLNPSAARVGFVHSKIKVENSTQL